MPSSHPVQFQIKSLFLIACLFINLAFPTSAYSASKTILVLGDSLSAEYGLPRGKGWVALLEQRLEQKKFNTTVINASISGDTTSGGAARLPLLLSKYQPNIVIIELGGNDALRGLDLKASEANFRSMIQKSKSSKAQVLLVGMRIPPNYGKSYAEHFYSIYAGLAKEQKISLVPFLLDGIAENTNLFQADRIHPLAEAHPLILENVWSHLHPLMK